MPLIPKDFVLELVKKNLRGTDKPGSPGKRLLKQYWYYGRLLYS